MYLKTYYYGYIANFDLWDASIFKITQISISSYRDINCGGTEIFYIVGTLLERA